MKILLKLFNCKQRRTKMSNIVFPLNVLLNTTKYFCALISFRYQLSNLKKQTNCPISQQWAEHGPIASLQRTQVQNQYQKQKCHCQRIDLIIKRAMATVLQKIIAECCQILLFFLLGHQPDTNHFQTLFNFEYTI